MNRVCTGKPLQTPSSCSLLQLRAMVKESERLFRFLSWLTAYWWLNTKPKTEKLVYSIITNTLTIIILTSNFDQNWTQYESNLPGQNWQKIVVCGLKVLRVNVSVQVYPSSNPNKRGKQLLIRHCQQYFPLKFGCHLCEVRRFRIYLKGKKYISKVRTGNSQSNFHKFKSNYVILTTAKKIRN